MVFPRSDPLTKIAGSMVVVRAFGPGDEEAIHAGRRREADSMRGHGPDERRHVRRMIERAGMWSRSGIDAGIEVDGVLVGEIQARAVPKAFPPGVCEIGVSLYDVAQRGRGYGREAVKLFTDWLFDVAGADRVQATTLVNNVAMRRVFEHLGFAFEGVLRGFFPAEDGRDDSAMYAILKNDR